MFNIYISFLTLFVIYTAFVFYFKDKAESDDLSWSDIYFATILVVILIQAIFKF